jgi:hypothetical protein
VTALLALVRFVVDAVRGLLDDRDDPWRWG